MPTAIDKHLDTRLAWPLHKDDTLSQSGRFTDLNIYFLPFFFTSNLVAPLVCGMEAVDMGHLVHVSNSQLIFEILNQCTGI